MRVVNVCAVARTLLRATSEPQSLLWIGLWAPLWESPKALFTHGG
jgi:hypothetical protein